MYKGTYRKDMSFFSVIIDTKKISEGNTIQATIELIYIYK